MKIQMTLTHRHGDDLPVPSGARVDGLAHAARGGPQSAALWLPAGDALEVLGARVLLHSEAGDPLWWGRVEQVTHDTGADAAHFSLASLVTRAALAYSVPLAGGRLERRTTPWVEDAALSHEWGTFERLFSAGRVTHPDPDAAALRLLDARLLAARAALLRGWQSPAPSAGGLRLQCAGWYAALSRRCDPLPAQTAAAAELAQALALAVGADVFNTVRRSPAQSAPASLPGMPGTRADGVLARLLDACAPSGAPDLAWDAAVTPDRALWIAPRPSVTERDAQLLPAEGQGWRDGNGQALGQAGIPVARWLIAAYLPAPAWVSRAAWTPATGWQLEFE